MKNRKYFSIVFITIGLIIGSLFLIKYLKNQMVYSSVLSRAKIPKESLYNKEVIFLKDSSFDFALGYTYEVDGCEEIIIDSKYGCQYQYPIWVDFASMSNTKYDVIKLNWQSIFNVNGLYLKDVPFLYAEVHNNNPKELEYVPVLVFLVNKKAVFLGAINNWDTQINLRHEISIELFNFLKTDFTSLEKKNI